MNMPNEAPRLVRTYAQFFRPINNQINENQIRRVSPNCDKFGEVCAICTELIDKNTACCLSCNHYFHCECIREWFKKSLSCPLCRKIPQERKESNGGKRTRKRTRRTRRTRRNKRNKKLK